MRVYPLAGETGIVAVMKRLDTCHKKSVE